jgi:hypothetical protein
VNKTWPCGPRPISVEHAELGASQSLTPQKRHDRGPTDVNETTRSTAAKASGLSTAASTTVNTAVLAPMRIDTRAPRRPRTLGSGADAARTGSHQHLPEGSARQPCSVILSARLISRARFPPIDRLLISFAPEAPRRRSRSFFDVNSGARVAFPSGAFDIESSDPPQSRAMPAPTSR